MRVTNASDSVYLANINAIMFNLHVGSLVRLIVKLEKLGQHDLMKKCYIKMCKKCWMLL